MVADDLVYDIGLHKGEDTAFYLRKGYRVTAFEANPALVEHGRRRFAAELKSGRVEIIEGAIADSTSETISFYQNRLTTAWGTTEADWVERNRTDVERIDVPVVRLRDHLLRTGTPFYVKIDIEGADGLCLDALLSIAERPRYLSIEASKRDIEVVRKELDVLEKLGFDRFAAVQQWGMARRTIRTRDRAGSEFSYRFEPEASGSFGDDIDQWFTRAEIERRYRAIYRRYRFLGDDALINRFGAGFRLRTEMSRLLRRPLPGWYDTHARKS